MFLLEEIKKLPYREQRAALHREHAKFHRGAEAEHALLRERAARKCHQKAAKAHEILSDGRYDPQGEAAALELTGVANHSTYKARQTRGR